MLRIIASLAIVLCLCGCRDKFKSGDYVYHKLTRQRYLVAGYEKNYYEDNNPRYTLKYVEGGYLRDFHATQAELLTENEFKQLEYDEKCKQLAQRSAQ